MSKYWFFCCCFLLLNLPAQSQTPVSTSTILQSAQQDQAVQWQSEHLSYMRAARLNLPFIDRVDLRTETDRFELSRQEFLSRINLNGLQEIRRNRQLHAAERREEETRQALYRHEALARRYDALADYHLLLKETRVLEQLELVYADKLIVLNRLALQTAETDVDELVKTEFDRDELLLRKLNLENTAQNRRAYLAELAPGLPDGWTLDTAGFVAANQLPAIAAALQSLPLQHPELAEHEARLQRLDAEFRLEKAEARQVLDFAQLQYNRRDNDDYIDQAVSVGIGVHLPFRGSSRVRMEELKIEKNSAGIDRDIDLQEMSEKIREAADRLNSLDRQRETAGSQLAESQGYYEQSLLRAGQALGPLTLLRARELLLRRQQRLLVIEREMFREYLNILDWSGQLSAAPGVNYLSAELVGY